MLDIGAGVGQYGHALLARDRSSRYRGVDGAGDVEEMTASFVRFADLTQENLALPKACWVVSFAVAEHVPRPSERAYVRNLHAHACRGVVLHWGPPGVSGRAHVNTRPPPYVQNLFAGLGYREAAVWSRAFRYGFGKVPGNRSIVRKGIHFPAIWKAERGPHFPWFTSGLSSTMVFERHTPLRTEVDGCQDAC